MGMSIGLVFALTFLACDGESDYTLRRRPLTLTLTLNPITRFCTQTSTEGDQRCERLVSSWDMSPSKDPSALALFLTLTN